MELTPVTTVERYVSINGTAIVRISRSKRALGVYADPPVIEDLMEAWGICYAPDWFAEIGQLPDVLMKIGTGEMVADAARASPREFAEMVAAAENLGSVLYPGCRPMWWLADEFADAKRFCSIEVTEGLLNFHAYLHLKLFGKQREVPGVYRVTYSLSEFAIQSRVLIEEYPKQS